MEMDPPADSMIRKRAKVNEDFPVKEIIIKNPILCLTVFNNKGTGRPIEYKNVKFVVYSFDV